MTSLPSRAIMLFGTEENVPPAKLLRAGPLTVELTGGSLRYVRYQGVEALRGIAFLVRDAHWGTYGVLIENLKVGQGPGEFSVSYDAVCKDDTQVLRYAVSITGKADGSLAFRAEGRAATDFVTRRAGFVVLHPIEGVAGEEALVTHTDGRIEQARFPRLISPAQPLLDLRVLAHEVLPGVRAVCTMTGDAYEMEDQRNWTDASYKTYIRPLAKPAPFTIAAGERFEQAVTLAFEGASAGAPATTADEVVVTVGRPVGVMPEIGLAVPPAEAGSALAVLAPIRTLGPGYLVGHLDLRAPSTTAALADLRRLAEALGVAVDLEIVLAGARPLAAELGEAAAAAGAAGLAVRAVVPSPHPYLKSWQPRAEWPDVAPLEVIYEAARAAFPGALIGGGMLAYFTELNRKRPPVGQLDFITHSTCPIVHDADDRAVMETLEALPWVAASVRAFAGGRPYRIGPTTIGMRLNPYGVGPAANPAGGRVAMAGADPRQRGLFGAAWNLGYAARMAAAGVEALCLSAPVGAFGLVHARRAEAQPQLQPRPWLDEGGGEVYPAYHVIRGLAAAAGRQHLEAASTAAGVVQAVAHQEEAGVVVWLANLTARPVTVVVDGLPAGPAQVLAIDSDHFAAACTVRGPDARPLDRPQLRLGAHAVARIAAG